MAAGRGNRLRPLTDIIPKAMLPYKKDTLIGHNLKVLHDSVSHVHITVGYKRAMLSEYLMSKGNIDTIINTEGHDNSWWIYHTLMQYLDNPVLVLTCDNITEIDMEFLNTEYYKADAPACMVIPVYPIPMIDGDYVEQENSFVTSIQRERPTEIYCSGIQVLNPARVVSLTKDEGNFYNVWNQLISCKELKVSNIYSKQWFTVNTLEQLMELSRTDDTINQSAIQGSPAISLMD